MTLSELSGNELAELRVLARSWEEARLRKDFPTADRLRQELMEWGAFPPEGGWHPVFESRFHRKKRHDSR